MVSPQGTERKLLAPIPENIPISTPDGEPPPLTLQRGAASRMPSAPTRADLTASDSCLAAAIPTRA
jgi:hypothetical protein